MLYYAGDSILDQLGLPVKRVSIVDNKIIREFYKKPQNEVESLSPLPPNIVDTPLEDWEDALAVLKSDNIRLLGRFAQMKSKMMFTDIIDESFKLVENL
jgi:hypothetical protein